MSAVTVCKECMFAECGGQRGALLIDISREQYDARTNVCPDCDRVTECACIEGEV
jgi:hypothetical protein